MSVRVDVEWRRPGAPEERLECKGVAVVDFVRRLAAAVRNYGSVKIIGFRLKESLSAREGHIDPWDMVEPE